MGDPSWHRIFLFFSFEAEGGPQLNSIESHWKLMLRPVPSMSIVADRRKTEAAIYLVSFIIHFQSRKVIRHYDRPRKRKKRQILTIKVSGRLFLFEGRLNLFSLSPQPTRRRANGQGGVSNTKEFFSNNTREREREDDRYKLVPEAAALSSWPDKKLERVIRDLQEEKSWSKSNTKMKRGREKKSLCYWLCTPIKTQ